jgi:hypothetical protein
MAYDVFISYATGDKDVADAVCTRVEAAGLRCWIAPRDILPGREWATSIVQAIEAVRAFVLVFSSHSNNSHHVRREVELAMHSDVVVVPFRVEPIDPQGALLYYIGDAHWLDALTPPLEEHADKLSDTLVALLGEAEPRRRPVDPPPPPPEAPRRTGTPPRRNRRVVVSVISGLVLAALVAVAGIAVANSNGAGDLTSCVRGKLWQQQRSPYIDGTVVSSDGRVGVMAGGALIGVQSAEEFAAAGLADQPIREITPREYSSLDAEPRDGLVLGERQSPGSPGRLFYATGGAVFQVQDPEALRKLALDPDRPTIIPAHGLDGAARVPASGTLLRVHESDTTWLIQGGARRATTGVCSEANVNVLPADPHILDAIPVSTAGGG